MLYIMEPDKTGGLVGGDVLELKLTSKIEARFLQFSVHRVFHRPAGMHGMSHGKCMEL